MDRRSNGVAALLGAGLLLLGQTAADARPAQCFATDDGHFACDFRTTDSAGSFTIVGPEATYIVLVDSPGRAFGFVNLGNRNIPLAGPFVRERADPACWANAETGTRICAWGGRPRCHRQSMAVIRSGDTQQVFSARKCQPDRSS
ncbi:hypothetical protein GTW51_02570 [Aurantimonas aggregata]|uniref:Uncharacterized protein n=1 Tax=Aurantimonas aggregata TaxID=2047720 RepID=A0A6L9MD73_9HYPH|nr:hypothetical protein [Aurantimonas aggregata]NDV85576.1 hypothetical protein [Aurantimonas aggregata]